MNESPFVKFVVARHRVYLNKAAGHPKPWTPDPILQQYRFCNVYRELDAVTKYVRMEWAPLHAGKDHVWFNMAVARLLNWPDTLRHLGAMVPWRPVVFITKLTDRQTSGQKVFGPAYIVSTNGRSMPKPHYLADHVLTPLWEARGAAVSNMGSLSQFHGWLMGFQGLGSFMAAQVVADTKNTPGGGLLGVPDWWTWAAPGPGSMRGLNRIMGNGAKKNGISPARFLAELHELQKDVNHAFRLLGWPRVCAQDIQNCLCEFDKYERVRLGEGRPKQGYPGRA